MNLGGIGLKYQLNVNGVAEQMITLLSHPQMLQWSMGRTLWPMAHFVRLRLPINCCCGVDHLLLAVKIETSQAPNSLIGPTKSSPHLPSQGFQTFVAV